MLVLYKIHRDEYETWIRGLGKKKKKKKRCIKQFLDHIGRCKKTLASFRK